MPPEEYDDDELADIEARAEEIARAARQRKVTPQDKFHTERLRRIVTNGHECLERMQVYRAVADHAMESCAEEEPLTQLLAHATALARGGEMYDAMRVAKVAGVIARAAKNNALMQSTSAPLVQFVPGNEKNADQIATIIVSTSSARAGLSKLIDNALQGDVIILERRGLRVAKIVPYTQHDFARELEARVPPMARKGEDAAEPTNA